LERKIWKKKIIKGLNFLFSSDEREVRQLLYNNYKHEFLSSSIPLNLYKKYLNMSFKLKDLNIKEYGNNNLVKNLILENNNNEELSNYLSMDGYSTDFYKIIVNNFIYSIELLKGNIVNKFNVIIKDLNLELLSVKSKISSVKNFIENKENLIKFGAESGSVKTRKLLKKERTHYLGSVGSKEIALQKKELDKLLIKCNSLESEILIFKNELEEFNKISLDLNIDELNKLNELKSNNEIKNINKFKQ
jgi:hypothetical protein